MLFLKLRRRAVVMTYALVLCILPCALADDHYAAQNGQTPSGNYTTWGSAASNIQAAVYAADTNDTVWVGAGRYVAGAVPSDHYGPSVVVINKSLTLRSSNGVPASVSIDGGGLYRGVAISNNVKYNTNLFIIDGFTISNCYATNFGGGILIYELPSGVMAITAVVQNCVIADNIASNKGGGVYLFSSATSLIVSNCVIRNNLATNNAAAAALGGGGLYAYGETLIANSRIYSNRWGAAATYLAAGGGGVYFNGQNSVIYTIRNTLMYANSCSSDNGSAVFLAQSLNNPPNQSMLNLINCTIVANYTTKLGAGGFDTRYENFTVNSFNTIIYSNEPNNFGPYFAFSTNLYFTNSCLRTNGLTMVVGSSNTTNSPDFVDWTGKNFRLNKDSPCMNKGLNQAWMDGAKDLEGSARVDRLSGRVDMGCYEYHPRGVMFATY